MHAMWLLVVTLRQICNEKEQAEQGKLQSVQFEEKGAPGNILLVPCVVLREIQSLKKNLFLNGLRVRPRPPLLPTSEKKLKESFISEATAEIYVHIVERLRQETELGSFVHVILDLTSRIQERGVKFFSWLRKARYASEASQHEDSGRPLCETGKIKSE